MNEAIPTKPDWTVDLDGEGWLLGLAAYDGGFVVLQPWPNGEWNFAAYIPNQLVRMMAGKLDEQE